MSTKAKVLLVLALIAAMYIGFDAYYKPYVRKAERYDELKTDYDELANSSDDYETEYENLKAKYDRMVDDILELVSWHDIPEKIVPLLDEDDEYDYLVLEIYQMCSELRSIALR